MFRTWLLFVLFVPLAAFSEPINILGFEIGGKAPPLSKCKTDKQKEICWSTNPYKSKHGYIGKIQVNDKSKLPQWADYGVFEISIDARGMVEQLFFEPFDARQNQTIINAIKNRFGNPTNAINDPVERLFSAEWENNSIYIHFLSNGSNITKFTFSSLEQRAEQKKLMETRRKEEEQRPKGL